MTMNAFTARKMAEQQAIFDANAKIKGPRRPINLKRANARKKRQQHQGNHMIRAQTNRNRSNDVRNNPVWHGCINGSPIIVVHQGGTPKYLLSNEGSLPKLKVL